VAKKEGTKLVVWANWSVNLYGRTFSGRDQFNKVAFGNYKSRYPARHESGLGHVASVVKGALRKRGDLRRDQDPILDDNTLIAWLPESGPKEISRGRAKSPGGEGVVRNIKPRKIRKGDPGPGQISLFEDGTI
jgi:hypothetical protein